MRWKPPSRRNYADTSRRLHSDVIVLLRKKLLAAFSFSLLCRLGLSFIRAVPPAIKEIKVHLSARSRSTSVVVFDFATSPRAFWWASTSRKADQAKKLPMGGKVYAGNVSNKFEPAEPYRFWWADPEVPCVPPGSSKRCSGDGPSRRRFMESASPSGTGVGHLISNEIAHQALAGTSSLREGATREDMRHSNRGSILSVRAPRKEFVPVARQGARGGFGTVRIGCFGSQCPSARAGCLQSVKLVFRCGDLLKKMFFVVTLSICVRMSSSAVSVKHSLQEVDSPLCMAQFRRHIGVHKIKGGR